MRSRPTPESPATFTTSSEGVRIGPFQARRTVASTGPNDCLPEVLAGPCPSSSSIRHFWGLDGHSKGLRRHRDRSLLRRSPPWGGVLCDLIIGVTPPAAFVDTSFLVVPLVAAFVTFWAHPVVERLMLGVLIFDAAGLGLFCVAGTTNALSHGLGPLQAVLLGVTTAVGGGVVRDLDRAGDPRPCPADDRAVVGASGNRRRRGGSRST
jgi:hypothetical protein